MIRWLILIPLSLTFLSCQISSLTETRSIGLREQIEFNRTVTYKLLDEIEKSGKARQILAWAAGPDHAPIGWHFMHIASTEDRFAQMLRPGPLVSEELANRYSSGKQATRNIPSPGQIRRYMDDSRSALLAAIDDFDMNRLNEKPSDEAPFDFATILKILPFHEAHHQGQAHATFNLWKDK
ncbi:MAG: DinB family protein [Leptospiraceae bacterium]